MKFYISMPMTGRTEQAIHEDMQRYFEHAKRMVDPAGLQEDIELIDSCLPVEVFNLHDRMWCIGESIKRMSEADWIFFVNDWQKANGCRVEHSAAQVYSPEKILYIRAIV